MSRDTTPSLAKVLGWFFYVALPQNVFRIAPRHHFTNTKSFHSNKHLFLKYSPDQSHIRLLSLPSHAQRYSSPSPLLCTSTRIIEPSGRIVIIFLLLFQVISIVYITLPIKPITSTLDSSHRHKKYPARSPVMPPNCFKDI